MNNNEKNNQHKNYPSENPNHLEEEKYHFNVTFLKVMVILVFSVLLYQLYNLQIINGATYKERALNNKKHVVKIPAYRGEVFSGEEEEKIVENLPAYSLFIVPKVFYDLKKNQGELDKALNALEEKFDLSKEKVIKVLERKKVNPFTPVLVRENIDKKTIFYLSENAENFPGLIFANSIKRNYLKGENFAHVTGYLQRINAREYQAKKDQGYYIDSFIGKQGVESSFDQELRGRTGFKIQIMDVKKRVKEEINNEDNSPIPGHNIYLTIEPRIQNLLANVMKNYIGGVIVTRVADGEVLGLYSSPSYDPNIFSGKLAKEEFQKLIDNKDNPFFNRVIQGEYPPSSIFKLVMALTALDNPNISFNTKHYCEGGLRIGGQYFKCTAYHGLQDFTSAIANSCNVFFYKLGIDIGPNSIYRSAKTFFNLGELEQIDLPFEKKGRVPSQKWKIERIGNFWWDGDTANLSIGQGFSLVTILQVNTITAAIANNGIAYKPHLVKKLYDLNLEKETIIEKNVLVNLPFSQLNIKRIQNAMRQVVRWGTASRIDNKKVIIAGKTGTAEVSKNQETHAWFTGYAPYGDSQEKVVITVLLEHGGFGGVLAATFARAILDGIFLGKDPNLTIKEILQPWESQKAVYEEWLRRNNQEKLAESYFTPVEQS